MRTSVRTVFSFTATIRNGLRTVMWRFKVELLRRRNLKVTTMPRFSRKSSFLMRAGPNAKEDEELPWERKEKLEKLAKEEGQDLPFAVYLIGSAIIAIAAVGSIFEIVNRNAIFGVLPPSNPLWLPILGFFTVTGFPSAGYLFVKAINSANAAADRQNKIDGY